MFERVENYFYGRPGRIKRSGKWIAMTGASLMMAGAIGLFVTRATNVIQTMAKQTETTKALSDIYPTLPLWWVPESWFGIFVSVVLIVVGVAVSSYGKDVDRMLRGI
jgi:hypothetical protein